MYGFEWCVLNGGGHIEGWKFETYCLNPLNDELNPICHLLALLGAHHIFHVSGLRVKNIKKIRFLWRVQRVYVNVPSELLQLKFGQLLYMHPVLPVYRANWFKHLDEFKPSIFVEPVTCLKASLFIHSYCVFMPIKRLLTSQHIRLSSCFSYDHRFSGTLGVGVGWQWVTDLSGQPIWPNLKCQSFEQDRLLLIKSRFEATFIGTSSCAERSRQKDTLNMFHHTCIDLVHSV